MGTGLKKWMPTKRAGFVTNAASLVTERLEVLVAMMASSRRVSRGAREQLLLDRHDLGRGLDEEVGVGAGGHVGARRDARQGGVARGRLHAALVDQAAEALLDAGHAALDELVGDVDHHDVEAGDGRHLDDAGAHLAGAGDEQLLHGHEVLLSSSARAARAARVATTVPPGKRCSCYRRRRARALAGPRPPARATGPSRSCYHRAMDAAPKIISCEVLRNEVERVNPGLRGRVLRGRAARLPRQAAHRRAGAHRRDPRRARHPALLRPLQQRHGRPAGRPAPPQAPRRRRLHLAAPRLEAALPRGARPPARHLLLHARLDRFHRRPVQGVPQDPAQVRRGEGGARRAAHHGALHASRGDRDPGRGRPRRQAASTSRR